MQQIVQPIKESFVNTLLRRLLFYVAAGIIIGTGIVIYQADPAIRQTVVLATTVKPDPVTELYFNDYQNLPNQLALKQPFSFSFHISNHMARTISYRYTVADVTASQTTQVTNGEVTVRDGGGVNETVHFALPQANEPSQIIVSLQNPVQHIDFWTLAK
ncbi:MAG TPA: hypothetical protein VMS08_02360 [Candidatus Saccharimonadia bacterium]|nr:hypothetical protein [Candidatus Saccharimonadia bacterium]